MSKFWASVYDLLKTSTLIQGAIALLSTGTIAYLYITGKSVPDTLVSIVMVILGYYFGSKAQQNSTREALNQYYGHKS